MHSKNTYYFPVHTRLTDSTIALHSSTTCWRARKQQHSKFIAANFCLPYILLLLKLRQKIQIFVFSVFQCLIPKKCVWNQLVFIQQNCSLLSRWLLIGITWLLATEQCWSSRHTPMLKIRPKLVRIVEKYEIILNLGLTIIKSISYSFSIIV